MTSRLKSEIFQIHHALSLHDKSDNLAFVHAVSEFYSGSVTPVFGLVGAQGHWWLEHDGEIVDPFNTEQGEYVERARGLKELSIAMQQHVYADQIFDHSADILSFIVACPEDELATNNANEDITAAAVCRP